MTLILLQWSAKVRTQIARYFLKHVSPRRLSDRLPQREHTPAPELASDHGGAGVAGGNREIGTSRRSVDFGPDRVCRQSEAAVETAKNGKA